MSWVAFHLLTLLKYKKSFLHVESIPNYEIKQITYISLSYIIGSSPVFKIKVRQPYSVSGQIQMSDIFISERVPTEKVIIPTLKIEAKTIVLRVSGLNSFF